mgnify:CR=1 FL=1
MPRRQDSLQWALSLSATVLDCWIYVPPVTLSDNFRVMPTSTSDITVFATFGQSLLLACHMAVTELV